MPFIHFHISSIPDSSNPPCQEMSLPSHLLSVYRDYLQTRYHSQESISSSQWPPVPVTKVFKLAMIQKEKLPRGEINTEFIKLSITGKVDDILQQKTQIHLENIFSRLWRKAKICTNWRSSWIGKEHTCSAHLSGVGRREVVSRVQCYLSLVRLRDPIHYKHQDSSRPTSLCQQNNGRWNRGYNNLNAYGKGVLWVLDGWDELPPDLPSDSIINKLIQPDKFRENPLLKSSVIITSRPSSSAELHPLVSSRVEVLGFTPHELEQYFRECLRGESKAVQTLLERIRENPVVEGSCYLPLECCHCGPCVPIWRPLTAHIQPWNIHSCCSKLSQSDTFKTSWKKRTFQWETSNI